MNQITVLVVDDSAFMRKVIKDLLSSDPEIEVIGTARNGEDALKKIPDLKPQVVTLDVEMPIMDGLTTLKEIVKRYSLPVVMLSSLTKAGTLQTIEAIENGAIDFVAKPSGSISLDLHKVQAELIAKVKLAREAKINIPTEVYPTEKSIERPITTKENSTKDKLIAIGTSTGGPKALVEVISKLPGNLVAPVLVVQHMPAGFTKSLAERLDKSSHLKVKEAEDGERTLPGNVYIAPGGYHLKVRQTHDGLRIELDQVTPPVRGHRPSVDTMFHSLANVQGYQKMAVIMTGMGSDGTQGLLSLKRDENTIAIAESQETSVVFGMPRAAIATQKIDEVVNVTEIAQTIVRYFD